MYGPIPAVCIPVDGILTEYRTAPAWEVNETVLEATPYTRANLDTAQAKSKYITCTRHLYDWGVLSSLSDLSTYNIGRQVSGGSDICGPRTA